MTLREFHLKRQPVVGRWVRKADAIFAIEFGAGIDCGGHHRRKGVNAPDHDHLIGAPDDSEARRSAAACAAFSRGQADQVPGTKAQQRLALAIEVGQHKLALATRFPRDDGVFARHYEFRLCNIGGHKVQIVLFGTLAGKVA